MVPAGCVAVRRATPVPVELPGERTIDLSAPPVSSEPPPAHHVQVVAGALLAAASGTAFAVLAGDARYLSMSVVMALGSLAVSMLVRRRVVRAHRASEDAARATYLRQVDSAVRDAAAAAGVHRQALATHRPPATTEPAGGWWHRHVGHPDFGSVRVGTGVVPARVRIRLSSSTQPYDPAAEPARAAAHAAVEGSRLVHGAPVALDLASARVVAVVGPHGDVLDLVRAWVGELAASHAPSDVSIVVAVGNNAPSTWPHEWAWARWLPHTSLRGGHLARDVRTVGVRVDEVGAVIDRRPWTVVVDATGRPSSAAQLGRAPGRTLLTMAEHVDEVALSADVVVRLRPDGTCRFVRADADGAVVDGVTPERLTLEQGERLGRRLAPLHLVDDDTALDDTATRPQARTTDGSAWTDPDASPVRLGPLSAAFDGQPVLRVPLGVGPGGTVVTLDLRESAVGGSGPHGVLVGATGSGKSELLRSLVLALAMRGRPADVAFVLVDFKGGAALDPLRPLPHVAGLVTNLADDQAAIGRLQLALDGELRRRQERLRKAGCDSVRTLRERPGADTLLATDPMPDLLLVVDEFGELLETRPELLDTFVHIGRLGRSLGLHLLLSSQRLDEGRLRGLESHLGYRIALRTFTAAESTAVLGTPVAAALPPVPGVGWLRTADGLQAFRAATTSGVDLGSDHMRSATEPRAEVVRLVVPWSAGAASGREQPVSAGPGARTEMSALVERLVATSGPGARPVCLPALPRVVRLRDLLPHDTGPGVPLGLVDLPAEGRQTTLRADLLDGGHLAAVGGLRSGRTTLLRTLTRALAARHPPSTLQVVAVDTGGTLTDLRSLPHTSAVVAGFDADAVAHVLGELAATSTERLQAATGPRPEPPHLLLLVDDVGRLRREQPDAEEQLVALATAARRARVHVAVTAARWSDLRPALLDSVGTVLELRVDDVVDSRWPRAVAASLPPGPGAALTPTGAPARLAVVDGTEPVRDDPLGRRAPLLRPLPTTVHEDQVDTSGAEATGTGFLLGVAARRSRPLLLPLLEPGAHLLVYGDRGSGRSTLLSRAARWYASRPTAGQVRLHLVHPRRSLLDLVALPGVAAHAVTPAEVDRLVGGLVDQLRYAADRQPTQHVLVVDDADLIASFEPLMAGTPSALEPLVTFVPAAAEVGLHVLLARRVAGVARSAYDPVLARLRENAAAVLVLSGDRSEGPVVGGVSAQPMLPGRGRLVRPYGGPPDGELVQCALPRPAGG